MVYAPRVGGYYGSNILKYLRKGALLPDHVYVDTSGGRFLWTGDLFVSGNGQYRTHCDDGSRSGCIMPVSDAGHVVTQANLTEVTP